MRPAAASTGASAEGSERAIRRVLVVGVDDGARRSLQIALDRRGLEATAVTTSGAARGWLAERGCDLILASPDLVDALTGAGTPIIAIINDRDAAAGIRAIDAGAADCLLGVEDADLAVTLRRAQRWRPPPAIEIIEARPRGTGLIGSSAPMAHLRGTIDRVARHRATVLITGESGTGKELVARAIHDVSGRQDRRFVAVNCAAIPGPLLESELFGHRRGAFTDAVRDKPGLFEDADGGTLFLDEVGELPLALQVKLLRAIQESEIRRVGDTASIRVDVRLVAATLRDLGDEVRAGRFREDLFYRLNVLPVTVPPLRARREDVPELIAYFIERHRTRHGPTPTFTDDAVALLGRQGWQGNVRELENTVERVLVLADRTEVDASFVAAHLRPAGVTADAGDADPGLPNGGGGLSIKKATRALEEDLIRRALETTGGNRTNAARLLEISHRALLYKIKEYGIQ